MGEAWGSINSSSVKKYENKSYYQLFGNGQKNLIEIDSSTKCPACVWIITETFYLKSCKTARYRPIKNKQNIKASRFSKASTYAKQMNKVSIFQNLFQKEICSVQSMVIVVIIAMSIRWSTRSHHFKLFRYEIE